MDTNAIKSNINGLVAARESAEDQDAPASVLAGLDAQIADANARLEAAEIALCEAFDA